MIHRFKQMIGVEQKRKYEPGAFQIERESQVLDTEHTRQDVSEDIRQRENDLKQLKNRIRRRWEKYKHYLREAKENDGIEKLEAKTKAKEAKKEAVDDEKLYKLLWKELAALKNARKKDEQVKIISGDTYDINLTDVDTVAVENMAEKHRSALREREMNVEEFNDGVNRMEKEEVGIDFSDIEKDVAELEMQDVEIFVEQEDGGEVEQLPETDWNQK